MNYYYDLPSDIISIINDKVNDMYKEEHKKKMSLTFMTIEFYGSEKEHDNADDPFNDYYIGDCTYEDALEMLHAPYIAQNCEEFVIAHCYLKVLKQQKALLTKVKAVLSIDVKYMGIDFNKVDMITF
jgi:hypothetical protein